MRVQPIVLILILMILGALMITAPELRVSGVASEAEVVCAAPDGDPEGSGSCWEDPLDLHTALRNAEPGTEVWLKQGTYTPGDDPHAAFYMPDGVDVIGGFTGSEATPDQRDTNAALTTLDGREISYTVLIIAGVENASISGLSIVNGAATLIADDATDLQRRGGGVFVSNSDVRFSNLMIANNRARFGGGGMYVDESSNIHLANVNFQSNETTHPQSGRGGALRIREGTTTLSDVTFRWNRAIRGGALFVDAGTIEIAHSEFLENEAADRGGAGSIYSGSLTVTGSRFVRNVAIREGGGLFVSRAGTRTEISDSAFERNRTGDGGGGAWIQSTEVDLARVRFLSNSAGRGPGGGLYLSNTTGELDAIQLQGNQAGVGGGIGVRNAEVVVINTLIAGNYAGPPEAVIDLEAGRPPSDDPNRENVISDPWRGIITGEIFHSDYLSESLDESAEFGAGGILAYGRGEMMLANTTVVSNVSEGIGSALFHDGDMSLDIRNSIVYHNSSSSSDEEPITEGQIYLAPAGDYQVTIDTTIVETGCPASPTALCRGVLLDVPRFKAIPDASTVPTTTGDYRLWFTSPAIDAGRLSLLPQRAERDVEGNPRIVQKRAEFIPGQPADDLDLGSYETQIPDRLSDIEVNFSIEREEIAVHVEVQTGPAGAARGSVTARTSEWEFEAIRLGRVYRTGDIVTIDGEAVLQIGGFVGFMIEADISATTGNLWLARIRLDTGYKSDWFTLEPAPDQPVTFYGAP